MREKQKNTGVTQRFCARAFVLPRRRTQRGYYCIPPVSDSLYPLCAPDEAGGTDAKATVTAAVAAAEAEMTGARKDLVERVDALKVAAKESKKTCRRLEQVSVGWLLVL